MARAEEIQEVRPGLYFWQAYEPSVKVDLSCCARQTARGLVFIDPIPLAKEALEELLSVGASPSRSTLMPGRSRSSGFPSTIRSRMATRSWTN